VTPAAFAESPWRRKVEIIDAPDFKPQVRAWLLHRPPAGRPVQPIVVFREALLEGLSAANSFLA
jgi:hypothetical protein